MLSRLRALLRPRDCEIPCDACGTRNVVPADAPRFRCWKCRRVSRGPGKLHVTFEPD